MTELEAFLKKQIDAMIPRSKWFNVGPLKVYMRAGEMGNPFAFSRQLVKTTCVANILELPPEYLGQGVFRMFMLNLEMCARAFGYDQVSVENVMPELLQQQLVKNGYTPHILADEVPGDPHTFYKSLCL